MSLDYLATGLPKAGDVDRRRTIPRRCQPVVAVVRDGHPARAAGALSTAAMSLIPSWAPEPSPAGHPLPDRPGDHRRGRRSRGRRVRASRVAGSGATSLYVGGRGLDRRRLSDRTAGGIDRVRPRHGASHRRESPQRGARHAWYVGGAAVVRMAVLRTSAARARSHRVLLLAAGSSASCFCSRPPSAARGSSTSTVSASSPLRSRREARHG